MSASAITPTVRRLQPTDARSPEGQVGARFVPLYTARAYALGGGSCRCAQITGSEQPGGASKPGSGVELEAERQAFNCSGGSPAEISASQWKSPPALGIVPFVPGFPRAQSSIALCRRSSGRGAPKTGTAGRPVLRGNRPPPHVGNL